MHNAWLHVALIALTLLSGCRGLSVQKRSDQFATVGADHLSLRYRDLLQPLQPSESASFVEAELAPSCPLLEEYPFLHLRRGQAIQKAVRELSGKGESRISTEYYLKAEGELFRLDTHGTEAFIYFDWDVSIENAVRLFQGIVKSSGRRERVLSANQFESLKASIARRYPETIVSKADSSFSPAKLIKDGDRVYVRCEAVMYIPDGRYYDEGKIENSFVKYTVDLGHGMLESEIEVLVRGPYQTDPVYWGGINGMTAPSDTATREAILRGFQKMNDFRAFLDRLFREAGIQSDEEVGRAQAEPNQALQTTPVTRSEI